MKKLLLLLCLPFVGFGQVCNSAYFDLDEGIIAEYPLLSGQPVPLDFPGAFTIEFWIKTTHSIQNAPPILYKDSEESTTNTQQYGLLNLHLDYNGFVKFRAYKYGSSHNPLISLNPVNDGLWHHIAVLRDTNNQMYMYEDGILVSQEQGCIGTVCEGPNPLLIGRSNHYGSIVQNALSGSLDNLRIWNRALSSVEIQQFMSQCVINDTDLLLYYDFDEILNTQFEDNTGTYNGQIINISLDNSVPICCDCQISNSDTSVCTETNVLLSSESTLNYLWSTGDTTSSILFNAIYDTIIALTFLDLSGNIVCSDSININIFPNTNTTIQQIGNILLSGSGQTYQWYLNEVLLSNETSQTISILGPGTYNVEVTDINGCSAISEDFIVEITNVINQNLNEVKLIDTYDIFGRKIYQNKFNSIVFLNYSNGTVEKRIIIE